MGNTLNDTIYVAGHRGMVGSALVRALTKRGYQNLMLRTRAELDLLDQAATVRFFAEHHIDQVYLAAAKVGGIHANDTYPADFILQNLTIQNNIITAALNSSVRRLLFLGSSCIYPRLAPQPIPEDALLTGPLEPTNEPYAVAKIAGIKMCESCNRQHGTDYRSVMPTNLYGPGDNYHPENSHVVPALLRRFHEAKEHDAPFVTVWGSGEPRREFLHVDDMASACVHLMELDEAVWKRHTHPMLSHVNIGCGEDCSIRELAVTVARVVGYGGEIRFDTTRPEGTPRKLLDVSRLKALGWSATIGLEEGLRDAYRCFLETGKRTH
jgi:GDP-L-fucose synthase